MSIYDFNELCASGDKTTVLKILSIYPDYFDLIPNEVTDEQFLLSAISIRPHFFTKIHRDKKTEKLCLFAFSLDRQYLPLIPEKFVTEEMAYRAAILNGDLVSRLTRGDLFSDRVIKSLIQSGHYDLVPTKLQKKEDIIESFSYSGSLPVDMAYSVKPFADALRFILENKDSFASNIKCSNAINKWLVFFDHLINNENPIDQAIQTISDTFETPVSKALAFIFLNLDQPIAAAKFLQYEPVRELVIPYHGEEALAKHADQHSRRFLIESSFNL
jgi:hypothetical protein